jgi:hypothetical protein
MRAWSTARGSEAVHALSLSVATWDSAVRSVVRWCPAVVRRVDRVVVDGATPRTLERRDRAERGHLETATSRQGDAIGSAPSPARGRRVTFRRKRLSAMCVADESGGHRRHPAVELARKSPWARAVGPSITTEPSHEDTSENSCESAGGAAHSQHRGAVPRASGGCAGSSGSPARSRASAPLTAYIGRNRWPKARLTFNGRCSPRTLRL